MRRLQIVFLALMLVILGAAPACAAPWELRGGDDHIDQGTVVAGDLFFSGDTLEVDGVVNGDLLVFAREVVVRGQVAGSIIGLVTDKLAVEGRVTGSLRVLAGNLVIDGTVGQMVSTYAFRLTTGKASTIQTGILGNIGELKLTGKVNGPVDVTVGLNNEIGGQIGANLNSRGAAIKWLPPVAVTGRVDDYSATPSRPDGQGKIQIGRGYHFHRLKAENPLFYKLMLMLSLVWFLGSLLLTLIFYRIFPRTAWTIARPTMENLQRSLLVGLLTLIGVPVVIVILLLTTVGLPIAVLLMLLYLVLLIFSVAPFSILLGRIVFRQYQEANPPRPNLLVIIGCLLASLFSALPIIGFIIPTCLGMGMVLRQIKPEFREVRLEIKE